MLDIMNSLNAHNFPIFEQILMILVSKFMVQRVLSDKTYLSLRSLSPLKLMVKKILTILSSKIVFILIYEMYSALK